MCCQGIFRPGTDLTWLFVLFFLLGRRTSKSPNPRCFKSDQMKFGTAVLHENTHRLAASHFSLYVVISRFRPRRHFTHKSAATWCGQQSISRDPAPMQQRLVPDLYYMYIDTSLILLRVVIGRSTLVRVTPVPIATPDAIC